MDIIALLGQCRYYSGERECPFKSDALKKYWDLERSYVMNGRGALISSEDEYYRNIGGKEYAGIPRALLIWMFIAYMKQESNTKKSLTIFYEFIDNYLEIASEQFPKDKIPHNR